MSVREHAEGLEDGDYEFDAIFSCTEGQFVGEAEGKDRAAIEIRKVDQLERKVQDLVEHQGLDDFPKGVLFGNPHRFEEPSRRGELFTQTAQRAATRYKHALVFTPDLFVAAKYVSESGDTKFAAECRRTLLDTVGVVSFPKIPSRPPKIGGKKGRRKKKT